MTREEAIKHIENIIPYVGENVKESFNMAIKALEQEPCEDAVSRKAVVQWLENATDDSIEHAIDSNLEFIPSVTPTRKKGKWIEEPNCWLRCSCCGSHYPHTSIYTIRGSKYCPNCGAEMESEE